MARTLPFLLHEHRKSLYTFMQRIFAGIEMGCILNILISREKIHSNQICYINFIHSSVRIQYKKNVVYEGIPAYRYETGDDFLRDIGPEYGNECYCMDRIEHIPSRPNGCLYRGAMDLSACQGKFNVL